MSYFQYKNGQYSVIPGKRPNNQSRPAVLKKIAARLERLIKENADLELTDLQKLFVETLRTDGSIALRANEINIAHNIAISAIMDAIVDRMNNPLAVADVEADQFAEDLLSTEDDEGKIKVKAFFELLRDPTITAKQKIAEADDVAKHMNRSSRNVIPGHARSNGSVSDYRDPHLVLKAGQFQETPVSILLGKSMNALTDANYDPKNRIKKGNLEYQSSSVCNIPDDSYYRPITKKRY